MAIKKRVGLGRKLTHEELDNNFTELENQISNIELTPGAKGEDFKYEDFTTEQLDDLRLTFDKLTPEQKLELKGDKGDTFTFDDLTLEQVESLRGPAFQYSDFTQEQLDELRVGSVTVPEVYNSVLTFDKNKYSPEVIQDSPILYSLSESGHIDGVVIRHKIISDGINTITFPSGFNVFGKPSNNIYPAGQHILYFHYIGGDVDIVIPTYISDTASEPAEDTTAPSVPQNLVLVAKTESSVDLSWTSSIDNEGVTGYRVYVGGVFNKGVSGTSTQVNGLTEGTDYNFSVSAIDAAGNESAQSAALAVTTEAAVVGELPAGASLAFGTARLFDTYSGALLRTLQVDNSAETDIMPTVDGDMDMVYVNDPNAATLQVITFYDQSGNGYDALAGTGKPLLKNAGNVYLINGAPSVQANSNAIMKRVVATQLVNSTTGAWSAFAICRYNAAGGSPNFILGHDGTTRVAHMISESTSGLQAIGFQQDNTSVTDTTASDKLYKDSLIVQTSICTGNTLETFLDGVGNGSIVISNPKTVADTFDLFGRGNGVANMNQSANLIAIVVYPEDKSATRASIETALKAKFGL